MLESPPLAVGDLNGDCALDVVDETHIYLSDVTSPPAACSHLTTLPTVKDYSSFTSTGASHPWSEAHIADMNGDGLPDVLRPSSATPASRSTAARPRPSSTR